VRLAKIELKKMCGGENKKYRRVGNECRLSCCPFVIWFVCLCPPVKMVYFFLVLSRLFVVVGSSFTLATNIILYAILHKFLVKSYICFVIISTSKLKLNLKNQKSVKLSLQLRHVSHSRRNFISGYPNNIIS